MAIAKKFALSRASARPSCISQCDTRKLIVVHHRHANGLFTVSRNLKSLAARLASIFLPELFTLSTLRNVRLMQHVFSNSNAHILVIMLDVTYIERIVSLSDQICSIVTDAQHGALTDLTSCIC